MRLRNGAKLFPDACPVELDRLHADAQRLGDLARQLAGEHVFHHFAFPLGKRCQARVEVAAGRARRRCFPLIAPPFGVGYYGCCAVSKVHPDEGIPYIGAYLAALVMGLIVVAVFPWISIGFL